MRCRVSSQRRSASTFLIKFSAHCRDHVTLIENLKVDEAS